MRSHRAKLDQIAVSANAKQTAMGTAAALDLGLLVNMSNVIGLERRREDDANELTGTEEATQVYNLGQTSKASLDFPKAQPQHFAFILAYALGAISTAAAGSGYEHTLTPIDGDEAEYYSNPLFTAAMRYGGGDAEVLKRRFLDMCVNSFAATFSADSWVQLKAEIVGTGNYDQSLQEESISELDTATSLTLAANGVDGATAAARLANVHQIRVELTSGQWTEVEYSAVSDATPAVITITAPGVAGSSKTYKVIYKADGLSWDTFPSRVNETPLRVSELTVKIGATWSGSALVGGRDVSRPVNSVEWSFNNNMQVEFVPGAGGSYASRIFRDGRTQKITLDKEFRDYALQNLMDNDETLGLYILAEGAIFDSPHKYQVEIIFPKVGVLNDPITVSGKRLAEKGDIVVLEDSTHGSVIVNVKNLQSAYAA